MALKVLTLSFPIPEEERNLTEVLLSLFFVMAQKVS